MKKNYKRLTALILSGIVAAASAPFNAGMVSEEGSGMLKKLLPAKANHRHEDRPPSELFSVMTLKSGADTLSADGRDMGRECGGFVLSRDNKITVNVDGKMLPLEEAKKEIGCEVIYGSNGDIMVNSPFQTASLIVRSRSAFDSCGAISAEEKAEDIYLLRYSSPSAAYKAYLTLSEDENIDLCEPDAVCYTAENGNDDEDEFVDGKDIRSWGNDAIGSEEFKEFLNNEVEELPQVTVAVLDTGIYSEHRMFEGRILDSGTCFVENYGTKIDDGDGHGSHCAGIICSSTNDNVKIMPVKVMDDDGYGTSVSVYCGFMYAIENGADIISMSLGSYGKSHFVEDCIAAAEAAGVTVCVSAGNESVDTEQFYSTYASIDEVVAVSSLDEDLALSEFSNYGMTIDFAAPGGSINSVGIDDENSSSVKSGTSMATPFVAACFANVLSYDKALSHEQAYNYLKANAIDLEENGFDAKTGWGLVNLRDFRFIEKRVEIPAASIKSGRFEEEIEVTLSCANENSVIYYTVDGSDPASLSGIKYDGTPIKISKTTTLRAVAVCEGVESREMSETYIFGGNDVTDSFLIKNGTLVKYYGSDERIDLKELTESGVLPEIKIIGDSAFKSSRTLKEIILPDSVTTICSDAFAYCKSLERVESNAKFIHMAAFYEDSMLSEFTSAPLEEVGSSAFYNCCLLPHVDAEKLTYLDYSAFEGCRLLTEECFDLSKITDYQPLCLKGTGISGCLDIRNAENIERGAFAYTDITEIIFPEEITSLPMEVLEGCSKLKKISAPSVFEVGCRSLALHKSGFSEENTVETDIDFSKMIIAGIGAFDGYVFDAPVSFDSLLSDNYLNAFEGAFGKELRLPTLKTAYSIVYDEYYGEFSCEFFVDTLWLENVTKFKDQPIVSCKAVVLGDGFEPLDESASFPIDGVILTKSDSDVISDICAMQSLTYSLLPYFFIDNYDMQYARGDRGTIDAYAIGDGCSYELYRVSGGKEVLVEKNAPYPVVIDTSSLGDQMYRFYAYDDEGGLICENDLHVSIYERKSEVLPIGEFNVLPFKDMLYADGDYSRRLDRSFTVDKTGVYNINAGGVYAEIFEDGKPFAEMRSCQEKLIVRLNEGCDYTVRFIGNYWDQGFASRLYDPFKDFIFCITPYDEGKRPISECRNFGYVSFESYNEYDPGYKPIIHLEDPETDIDLIEGVDFTVKFPEPFHEGDNTCIITGIGSYFGVIDDLVGTIYPAMQLDAVTYSDEYGSFRFVAPADGEYTIIARPASYYIDECISENALPSDWTKRWSMRVSNTKSDVFSDILIMHSDSTITNIPSCTFPPAHGSATIHMDKNDVYSIESDSCPVELMITQESSFNASSIEYDINQPFVGVDVIPVFNITDSNGTLLVEDEDYTVKCWKNEAPGVMFAYVESIGESFGGMVVSTVIDGGGITAEKINGMIVYNIETNKEVPAYDGRFYRFELDRDVDVTFMAKMENESTFDCHLYCEDDDDISYYITDGKSEFMKKGRYVLYFEYIGDENMTFSVNTDSTVKYIGNAEILLSDNICTGGERAPKMTLKYDGKTLKEGTDYNIEKPYPESTGMYSAIIHGAGDYSGYTMVSYLIITDDGKIGSVSAGTETYDLNAAGVEYFFEFVPDKEYYQLSTPSMRYLHITLYDEELNEIEVSTINKKLYCGLDVEPGKKYYMAFSCEIPDSFEVTLASSGLLEKCRYTAPKFMEIGDRDTLPDVTFTDGDYTLEYGRDYTLVTNGFINDIGAREYMYRGIGNYSGEVIVTVIGYTPELPEGEYQTIRAGEYAIVGGGLMAGAKKLFKFTSTSSARAEYHASLFVTSPQYTENSAVIAYDENGRFIGVNDDIFDIALDPGETVYFAAIDPYFTDDVDRGSSEATMFAVSFTQYAAETTEVPVTTAPVTTADIVTTAETTAAPVTTEPVTEPEPLPVGSLGDVNMDGLVDSTDATDVLVEYGKRSTGRDGDFTDEQNDAADVNFDGMVDSTDASKILQFYSYLSTGGSGDMREWLGV